MRHRILSTAIALAWLCWCHVEAAEPQQYRFKYVPLAVGDVARERVHIGLDLKTIRAISGQIIDVSAQNVERAEDATVVRLQPESTESARARIHYDASTQSTKVGAAQPAAVDRPVAGKTYVVARHGDELVITDEEGNTPAAEETAIVARSMAGLGRPSPLGVFLNGRSLTVGQLVRLPSEFTKDLLSGWDPSLADLPFDVMLIGTERVDGKQCALLHTPPADQTRGAGERQPIQGKFVIELESCRVALVELRGPIVSQERRGAPGEEFDVRRKGKLQVAVHIEHRRAR